MLALQAVGGPVHRSWLAPPSQDSGWDRKRESSPGECRWRPTLEALDTLLQPRLRCGPMKKHSLFLFLTACAALPAQPPGQTAIQFTQEGCPPSVSSMPMNQTPFSPADFIELDRIAAFSPIGPYQIRVFADGRIEREVPWCPLHPNDKTIHVTPEAARKLLIRARDAGFRQLCAVYTFVQRPGLSVDGIETSLKLSIHGQSSSVRDSVGNPPAIYDELEEAIQKLSPMDKLAGYASFTPERKAECDAIRARRSGQH